MNSIHEKISKTKKIVQEAVTKFGTREIALAWKGGKDTTTLMHIILTMYDGLIPFRVMFNDTTLEFKEVYDYIEKMTKQWNLQLLVVKHDERELSEYHSTENEERKKELSRIMKIHSLNKALVKYKLKGYMLGIRWDEHPARANEKYFSPRENHIRIHPLLHFTEKDIWEYIKLFNVPYLELYDKGYRSIGEKPFTKKASGKSERSGREQEKEEMMGKLRQMGYW
jgi:phosphoadenosine phosphosulfate reductase